MNESSIPPFVVEGGGELPLAYLVCVESQRLPDVLNVVGLSPKLVDIAEVWKAEPSWFKDSSLYEFVLADDACGDGKCWYVVPAGTHPLAVNMFSLLGRCHLPYENMQLGDLTVGPASLHGLGNYLGVEEWKRQRQVALNVVEKPILKKELPWPSEVRAIKDESSSAAQAGIVPTRFDEAERGVEGAVSAPASHWDLVRYDVEDQVRRDLNFVGDADEPTYGELIDLGEVWVHVGGFSEFELMEGEAAYYVTPSSVDSWEALPVWSKVGTGYATCAETFPGVQWQSLIKFEALSKVSAGLSARPTWKELSNLPPEVFVSTFELWSMGLYWRNGWWYRARRRGRLQSPVSYAREKKVVGWQHAVAVSGMLEGLEPEASAANGTLYTAADLLRAQRCSQIMKEYGVYAPAHSLMKEGLAFAFGLLDNGEYHQATVVHKVVVALEKLLARDMSPAVAVEAVKKLFADGDLVVCMSRKFGTVSGVALPAKEQSVCFLLHLFIVFGDECGGMAQLLDDVGLRRRWLRGRGLPSPVWSDEELDW